MQVIRATLNTNYPQEQSSQKIDRDIFTAQKKNHRNCTQFSSLKIRFVPYLAQEFFTTT